MDNNIAAVPRFGDDDDDDDEDNIDGDIVDVALFHFNDELASFVCPVYLPRYIHG